MHYTETDLQNQIKPLSSNGFVAFIQKIARWWLGVWYNFAEKRPKLSKLIYMVFFFFVFSMGVTIFQYIVMTFLPYAFASLNDGAWGWPNVPIQAAGGQPYIIFGDAQGLGYFIAFEIAVFLAQCINFPLQRNITYHSHGNPWYQAMWYFIGWVLVSVFTNAVWGICNCFIVNWGWHDAIAGIAKTVLTGGVSMVIFFFIFMVIFPDNNKVAKKARANYEKLVAAGAPEEKVEKAEEKMLKAEKAALLSNTEKAAIQATSQASAKAMKYFAVKKQLDKANTDEEKSTLNARLFVKFDEATVAIEEKQKAVQEFEAAKVGQNIDKAEENK